MVVKKFWRRSGKEQAAKCPVCGEYMKKVTIFKHEATEADMFLGKNISIGLMSWYCTKCNLEGKV